MKNFHLRALALALAATAAAPVFAHGDPTTHFHASHGLGTLAGVVFVATLAAGAALLLVRGWAAWRRRAGAGE